MKPLSIGEVARFTGVGVETVRFYEKEDLISVPTRRESGYRQYSRDVIPQIRFIKRSRELGFSLREIRELLSLRMDPSTTCNDFRERVAIKTTEIEEKIRDLQKMTAALERLKEACDSNRQTITECPFLDALDGFNEN
ncbi:MAG TPA: MerR family DNA-binding protein [Candidatus Saccharimonadales bacterium]|jgi:Hg(II)-responsive transcriptional regulator|nr:MerR family DNA-binding protein [Candidatus Saccharimonadales bacterium]